VNVLLCLLSRQHVPNLLSVHHFRPQHLVLVESQAMKQDKAAENFLTALRLGGQDYDRRCIVEPLPAEDDMNAIRKALLEAYRRFPSADWTANVTGGTKPMSMVAYETFKALNGRVFYTSLSHSQQIINLLDGTIETFQHRPSIAEFLAGYGFELRKSLAKVRQSEERARQRTRLARLMALRGNGAVRFGLDDKQRNKAREKGLDLEGQLKADDAELRACLVETFHLSDSHGSLHGRLDKYAVQFLTGGWLEELFWGQLVRHGDALGIHDVRLGISVARKGASSGENELDVAFMESGKLCVVECKTGSQDYDRHGDVLYKLDSIMNQFRALGVQAWLATTATNLFDATGKVKPHVQERLAVSRLRLLRGSDIAALAASPDDSEVLRNRLFGSRKPVGSQPP
jgi:hypothetical protein